MNKQWRASPLKFWRNRQTPAARSAGKIPTELRDLELHRQGTGTEALGHLLAQCARWLITILLFLLVFSRVQTLPKYAPDLLLDSSYGAALTYFRSQGLQ